jgi:transcriptional regulator GlxA family with amidase domain
LVNAAAGLELDVDVEAGSVRRLVPSAASRLVGHTLNAAQGLTPRFDIAPTVVEPGLFHALSRMLGEGDVDRSVPTARKIDDREVVLACMECADAVQRLPTIEELCAAAFVSERRLRNAFTASYDMPPHRFFLAWGLDLARRRLVDADPTTDSVTTVAAALGFIHLGRFARYYKQQFGESPSTTLRWNASAEGLR